MGVATKEATLSQSCCETMFQHPRKLNDPFAWLLAVSRKMMLLDKPSYHTTDCKPSTLKKARYVRTQISTLNGYGWAMGTKYTVGSTKTVGCEPMLQCSMLHKMGWL